MMRRSILAFTLVLPSLALAATPPALDRKKAPTPGAAPRIELPAPKRIKLSTGTSLLVVERHKLPMVAATVVWPAGASRDPAGRFGLNGLMVELLDEGTETRSATQLAAELEGLGARLDTFTTWDAAGVSLTSLTRNLPAALELLGDVLEHPAFDAHELERIRQERLTSLVQQRDAATQVASNVFASSLYGPHHRYGVPLLGDEEGLKAITREDVKKAYQARLRPEDATLIVVGDVDPERLRVQLEKTLAGWASPRVDEQKSTDLTAPPQRAQLVVVDRPGAPQSEVRIGHPGVSRSSPDYFPLVVANTLFGGYFASRLNTNLREAHGYTYGARSELAMRREGGPFVIGAPVKTDVTGPSLHEALAELDKLRAAPPGDEELRRAKDLLERALARRFETVENVSSELANLVVYQLPDDYLSTYAKNIEAVTAADVLRVAQQHLDPTLLTVVVVGDRKVVAEAQVKEKLPPMELRDAQGRPLDGKAGDGKPGVSKPGDGKPAATPKPMMDKPATAPKK